VRSRERDLKYILSKVCDQIARAELAECWPAAVRANVRRPVNIVSVFSLVFAGYAAATRKR